MTSTSHIHLKRLERVWKQEPIFFVTACTHHRQPILASDRVASILVREWIGALDRHGWAIGQYMVMPDHVHFFCAPALDGDPCSNSESLSAFMQQWKQWTSKLILRACSPDGPSGLQTSRLTPPIWQAKFFDHLLRSRESYAQKWEYVRHNPVRAGLVNTAEDWLWQGSVQEL